jgi:hypothetical protein
MNTEKTSLENESQPSCLGAVMCRIWFLILAIGYVIQVLSLIIIPISLVIWIIGLSDNYIHDYVKYTKRVLYGT